MPTVQFTISIEVDPDYEDSVFVKNMNAVLSDLEEVIGKSKYSLDDSSWEEL